MGKKNLGQKNVWVEKILSQESETGVGVGVGVRSHHLQVSHSDFRYIKFVLREENKLKV